jgi:hypothetical protein
MPSSGMWRHTATRRHIPEDGIIHSHRSENLKSYINRDPFYGEADIWFHIVQSMNHEHCSWVSAIENNNLRGY